MFGKNPKRKFEIDSGDYLMVQDIFHTIQGEGSFVGVPAVFVRLGGCNLACEFCDTEFENFSQIKVEDILFKIHDWLSSSPTKLIVITGGEPFRQNICRLVDILFADGFRVQIETNGTMFLPEIDSRVDIICSPKVVNGKYLKPREDLLARALALKFLISERVVGYSTVPDWVSEFRGEVFVQPMDEYNEDFNSGNRKLAVDIAMSYGYRLSIQTHKILDIP